MIGFLFVLLFGGILFFCSYACYSGTSETSTTIIGGVIAIIVAIISSAITKYWEHKNTIKNDLRTKKIPIYEEFISFALGTICNKDQTQKDRAIKAVRFFNDFTPRLVLWGSDEVLIAYKKFRLLGVQSAETDPNVLLSVFENLLFAMREDLGYKNVGLESGDILSLVVSDPQNNQVSIQN